MRQFFYKEIVRNETKTNKTKTWFHDDFSHRCFSVQQKTHKLHMLKHEHTYITTLIWDINTL